MKILYAGSPEAAAVTLKILIEKQKECGFEIVGVLSNPPSAKGRHKTPTPTPVSELAQEYHLPLYTPEHLDAQARELDLSRYGRSVFGMYGGQTQRVRLRFDRALTGVVIDRFGRDVMLIPDGPDAFIFTAEIAVSPNFFGWLAGFGARAQILSPEPVRAEFLALCRAAAAPYACAEACAAQHEDG